MNANEWVQKSGKSPTLFSNRILQTNAKQIGLFQEESPKWRGKEFLVVLAGLNPTSKSSLSAHRDTEI